MKEYFASLFPESIRQMKGADKFYHYVLGTVIYLLALAVTTTALILTDTYFGFWYRLVPFTFTLLVAVLVEVYDGYTGKGTPEKADVLYTMVTPTLGTILLMALHLLTIYVS